MRLFRFLNARLHRRLFVWTGFSILLSVTAGGIVTKAFGFEGSWRMDAAKAKSFVAEQFAGVWDEPSARRRLAESAADTFDIGLSLFDAEGSLLERYGPACQRVMVSVDVVQGERLVGQVDGCWPRSRQRTWPFWLGLFAAGSTLWIFSGWFAHRLTRPLRDLTRVAREIGEGNLKSQARLAHHLPGEVGELARSVNEMATRIEKQLVDQKELLAAVSHEVRTPLTRLRVLSELLREQGASERHLLEIEREILEIDELTGKLLAQSRLDFDGLVPTTLSGKQVALLALERAGLPQSLCVDESAGQKVAADATLLVRALANLLDNAQKHADGATELKLSVTDRYLVFEVKDAGPGFDPAFLPRAFERFARGKNVEEKASSSSLGLGLALVKRVAQAHHGRVEAENLAEGGALVRLSLPLLQPSTPPNEKPSQADA